LLLVIYTIFQTLGKIDLDGVTYLTLAVIFSFTAVGFNKASVLAGFLGYEPENLNGASAVTFPFSRRLRKERGSLSGKMFLMESRVGSDMEPLVRDFCIEQLSSGEKVFVVTNISSSLYRVLSKYRDIRFCLFSERVTRPQPSEKENEILIPQDGIATILDVIEKAAEPKTRKTLVLDNLTDIFITLGRQAGQKFLKTANEYIAEKEATTLFITYPEAMDTQVTNWVRSLFGNILTTSTAGMKTLKEESSLSAETNR
jgi:hypothetical protein